MWKSVNSFGKNSIIDVWYEPESWNENKKALSPFDHKIYFWQKKGVRHPMGFKATQALKL